MRDEIADSFGRLLGEACAPDVVRAIEAGRDHRALWRTLEETGYADALVPEEAGGAGLSLADASAVIELCGRHVVPLAFAETMVLRGVLAGAGARIPPGSITFGGHVRRRADGIVCSHVVCGRVADWVLVAIDGAWRLLPVEAAQRSDGVFALDAALSWPHAVLDGAASIRSDADVRLAQAFVHAVQLSGALSAAFERTLQYANDRQQFGRSIGKFQAIQHQLSIMAEHVFAARMAASIAASRDGARFDRVKIAVAKARASEAAVEVASLSHSIHGAIGFTEEYDLQLYTRRLHAWRQAAGSESYWHDIIGQALLAGATGETLDVLRSATAFV